jgi:SHS2 domain-containing protein
VAYRWVEHTGELELELEAPTEREVFEQGLAALRELLQSDRGAAVGEPGTAAGDRAVSLRSRDRATLLADWLAELAFLAESEGLVPERVGSLELGESSLEAVVEGYRGDPPHLVKAVTYHGLSFERSPTGGWRATAVLDV